MRGESISACVVGGHRPACRVSAPYDHAASIGSQLLATALDCAHRYAATIKTPPAPVECVGYGDAPDDSGYVFLIRLG